MMKIKHVLALLVSFIVYTGTAQVSASTHHGLHSPYNMGEYYQHEVGAGVFPYRLANAEKWVIGFHGHYIYNIRGGRMGFGLGYSMILDDIKQKSILPIFAYRPFHHITVLLSPGVTIYSLEGETKTSFAGNIEVLYEWAWRNVHFGPSVEYTYNKDFPHYSAGIHLGLGF